LWQLYKLKAIDLFFGDEACLSMDPCLPYGWQAKGETIGILPRKDKKINLLGFFQTDNSAITYQTKQNVNSQFIIDSIHHFCGQLTKPTVLVLDNAPTHTSEAFLAEVEKWQEKDLYVFFLPRYCPHLNKAEIYWRKLKYEWLKAEDYLSFDCFQAKLNTILAGIGTQYNIRFKEQINL
jgi:transposase